jgi:DNA-binding GntR family transcriptional regulator
MRCVEASLTQFTYERIRADLLSGKMRPGSRLKINELCEQLEVNLSAVREALSRLCADGLVVALPQRGFRVAPISAAELLDLTMTRIAIEQLCLRRAAANADISWETNLVAAGHQMFRTPKSDSETGGVPRKWFNAHRDFHRALVAGCESPWLLRLHDQLYVQAERYQRLSAPPLGDRDRDIDAEHRALMDAMLDRDADKACELIARHLDKTAQIVAASSIWDEQ